MDDLNDLDLELDTVEEKVRNSEKVKNRFEQLSEKVILTSRERDEHAAKAKAEEEARLAAEKERDFYKAFSSSAAKYPESGAYQDQILEKVKAGYETEDAILAVLAREGKLSQPAAPQYVAPPAPHAEGGSAATPMPGNKAVADMTSEEKLAALAELDRDGGLAAALRGL